MLEWKEVNPLPQRCIECENRSKRYFEADEAGKRKMELEEDIFFDCGSCDYALERFYLSREDELTVTKKGLQQALERLQKQGNSKLQQNAIKNYQQRINEIDAELQSIEKTKDHN